MSAHADFPVTEEQSMDNARYEEGVRANGWNVHTHTRPIVAGLIASLALLTGFSAGCRTVNASQRSEPRDVATTVEQQKVSTDASLSSKVSIVEIRETVVGNGLLSIQAEIQNRTPFVQRINYRFEWFDDAGMLIDTALSRWSQISLAGRESQWLRAVAPTPHAVDFKLKLLEP